MGVVETMFSQYSIEGIIIFALMLATVIKIANDLFDFFYNKIRKHFNYQNNKDRQHAEIKDGLTEIKNDISHLTEDVSVLNHRVENLEGQSTVTKNRLQESTRSYILDKHHYFCYEIRAIDDYNLQNLEARYQFYKNAGGNSFVDGLMEEIRALPRININCSKK